MDASIHLASHCPLEGDGQRGQVEAKQDHRQGHKHCDEDGKQRGGHRRQRGRCCRRCDLNTEQSGSALTLQPYHLAYTKLDPWKHIGTFQLLQ